MRIKEDMEIKPSLDDVQKSADEHLTKLTVMVSEIIGINLQGKETLVQTRLMRRVRKLGLQSLDDYYTYFEENKDLEIRELISIVTTHTTDFFRESGHFDYLYNHLFPQLALTNQPINIWSAGCSSGQEVYSIAITFLEYIRSIKGTNSVGLKFKVIGTDIDANSILECREGIYPIRSLRGLKTELVERYFDIGAGPLLGKVRVKDIVWQLCEFRECNITNKPVNLGTFNAIFARNMFIYFYPKLIVKSLQHIYEHLVDNGILFVGYSETIPNKAVPFLSLGKSIYKKQPPKLKVGPWVSESSTSAKASLIRVLIVDDSPTIRKLIGKVISSDPLFEVAGEAFNPIEAEQILKKGGIDLITLDINMPGMDGITYLRKIQGTQHPPIVMISTISFEQANRDLQCFALGAVDYIEKPENLDILSKAEEILSVLRAVASSKVPIDEGSFSGSIITYNAMSSSQDLIALGASTGGPAALQVVLEQFPSNSPPTLIVQHLPKGFSGEFAKSLSLSTQIRVVEAIDGTLLAPGFAYLAPGGRHMKVEAEQEGLRLVLTDEPFASNHKPSVNYLFQSIAVLKGTYRVSAAILTGMGKDGAEGLKAIRDRGFYTVAQDEKSSVVFGMPKVAIEIGGAVDISPISKIAEQLFKEFHKKK
ncbi:MAG: chemotaxis-specific protein-glutamate methyltransferase CheB [Bdellovibrionia bacterium]